MKNLGRRQILQTGLALGSVPFTICSHSTTTQPQTLNELSVDRSPINVTLTGVGVGGYFRVTVEIISTILREAYPGSAITFKPSTPAGGLQMLADGQADISFAAGTPELQAALTGSAPFKSSQKGKFGWFNFLHDKQVFYFIADKAWADKHAIRNFADLAAKKPAVRVANNRKGNLQTVVIAEDLFNLHGFSSQDINSWGGATSWVFGPEGLEQLADGKVDMWVNANFVQWANLSKLSEARELLWLDIARSKLESIANKWDYQVDVVPKGAYNFITEDKPTIKQWACAVVGMHVPDVTVIKVLTALRSNAARIRAVHPSMSDFSAESMAKKPTSLIPYHPAAEKFYGSSATITKTHSN